MHASNLQLTHRELELIIGDNWHDERFNVLENDIPKEGHSSQYIEDDGRQYRSFEFEDMQTGQRYRFGYTWQPEFPVEVPECLFESTVKGIEFVTALVLCPLVNAVPPVVVLNPVEQADKQLWAAYKVIEDQTSKMEADLKQIPKFVLNDVLDFMREKPTSIQQVRAKLVPLMIKYRIHEQTLWTHVQQKLGHWKKTKKV